jgi:hypothetical protein
LPSLVTRPQRSCGLLFAVAYYIVNIDAPLSGKYAGRVVTAHRSLSLVIAAVLCSRTAIADEASFGGTHRIVFSGLDFSAGQFIPPEDVAAVYATDGTPLT